jgi:hypothetical protein
VYTPREMKHSTHTQKVLFLPMCTCRSIV